ncbi:MAG: hypothetical protein RIE73_16575 [Coleofasciculus sp. C1-SOL-03]|uniref:PEP-CTERM sorting domain-containing protein n=1 Tax=Coleofasciculus sp. C1-SOL-03 TaxID=3069522 RepID=UPI0032F977A2
MRKHILSILLGLATTTTLSTPLPVQAEPQVYQLVSGKENLRLNEETFNVLESLGLSLASLENTVTPDPGFTVALPLLPPSDDPNVRGTTFTFSYDDETNTFIPLSGVEAFASRVIFNVNTAQLALEPQLVIGELSTAFSPDFEFFLFTGTIGNGLRLFDVVSPRPPLVDLENQIITPQSTEVRISQEFSDLLMAAGATESVAGLKIADVTGDKRFVEISTTKVPEPGSAIAILMVIGATLAMGKQRRVE